MLPSAHHGIASHADGGGMECTVFGMHTREQMFGSHGKFVKKLPEFVDDACPQMCYDVTVCL